jgi:ppGpp synthetase/RelA/SpoT-type nucleotidyltranferase
MRKVSWTDQVKYEEVLRRVKEERNIVHKIQRRTVNWIGHILRRECLLKHVIEGKLLDVKTKKKTYAPTG